MKAFKFFFFKRKMMLIVTWLIKKISMLHKTEVTKKNDVVQYIYDDFKSLFQIVYLIDKYRLNNDINVYSQTIKIQKSLYYCVWHNNMCLLYNTWDLTQKIKNFVFIACNDAFVKISIKLSFSSLQTKNANIVDCLFSNECRYCEDFH